MTRFASSLCALLAVGALAAPVAPAFAKANQYRAELSAPSSAPRLVVRDLVWSCGGDSCVTVQTTSRAATDCSALAGHVGALRSFSVGGQALPADELEKCNARAR
ncbi:MAG: putative secreted protein [Alphaproteobacteria bacterium]|nr:putative secreted protein [Alphaproteobacteria bacterium]